MCIKKLLLFLQVKYKSHHDSKCLCAYYLIFWHGLEHLTLIGPGEVKVDLADFDLKLQENLLSTLYIHFFPIPAETSSGSFWTSDMTSKNDVLTSIWHIFVRSPAAASPAEPPPSARFYCDYRSPEGGRSLPGQWSTVQCGASQEFKSVSGRGPRRVRGVAGSQSGLLSRSF
jgi:hypothetical protein